MKKRITLLLGASLLAGVVVVPALINGGGGQNARVETPSLYSPPAPLENQRTTAAPAPKRSSLEAALKELEPSRRKELLAQWADTVEIGRIEDCLAHLASMVDPEFCSEVRHALLSSWVQRDRSGMAAWFGKRPAADELHQESRDLLLKVLAALNPNEGFAWMESAMPESARRELSGPFFQQWADRDPIAAAAALAQMARASGSDPAFWNHLLADVAARWARADLSRAVAWTKSLPEGEARSQAMVQVSYLWTASDPRGAADYAARQNDLELARAVAGTWAETDPKNAIAWAQALPAGERQSAALATASAVWTQKDPLTAAAYANSLPIGEARNQALVAVASMWSDANPPQAATWVEQFSEGPARDQAFERLMNAWAVANAHDAGQWLQRLPASTSRDSAVLAFCGVIDGADPAASFAWAQTISDEATRNQKLERTAALWLAKDPAAARPTIAQSSLPEEIKRQVGTGSSFGQ